MTKVWIPPGDYSPGVKKILYAPGTSSVLLNEIVFKASTEDLEEAMKILEKLAHTKTKRDRIKKELFLRNNKDKAYKEGGIKKINGSRNSKKNGIGSERQQGKQKEDKCQENSMNTTKDGNKVWRWRTRSCGKPERKRLRS